MKCGKENRYDGKKFHGTYVIKKYTCGDGAGAEARDGTGAGVESNKYYLIYSIAEKNKYHIDQTLNCQYSQEDTAFIVMRSRVL